MASSQRRQLISRNTPRSSARAGRLLSPVSSGASLPDCPDQPPSHRQQFVHSSPRESRVRRHPSRLPTAREDQTCGTSSAANHKARTTPSPDRAQDKAHHSQSRAKRSSASEPSSNTRASSTPVFAFPGNSAAKRRIESPARARIF